VKLVRALWVLCKLGIIRSAHAASERTAIVRYRVCQSSSFILRRNSELEILDRKYAAFLEKNIFGSVILEKTENSYFFISVSTASIFLEKIAPFLTMISSSHAVMCRFYFQHILMLPKNQYCISENFLACQVSLIQRNFFPKKATYPGTFYPRSLVPDFF